MLDTLDSKEVNIIKIIVDGIADTKKNAINANSNFTASYIEEPIDGFDEKAFENLNTAYKSISLDDNFETLQKWIGAVKSMDEDTIYAELIDPRTKEECLAEIPLKEISLIDRPLLAEGAVFYWNIGYHHDACGQITRESIIKFRRLAPITDDRLKKIEENVQKLSKELNW